MTDATHDSYRELISAQLDGELGTEDEVRLDAHLTTCLSCRAYQDDAFALRRALRMRPVTAEIDESTERDTSFDIAGSLRGVSLLRWALFVIGGTLVLLSLPSLFSTEASATAHLDRHDGVFGAALGIGMLAVAAKPHRAIGLVPLTSAIAVLMGVVGVFDLVSGNANLLAEAVHVVEFAGLICLWVISGGPTRVPRHLDAMSSALRLAR